VKGRDTQEKQENSATCVLFFVINFFLLRGHIMDIIQLQLHHEQPFVRIYSKELKPSQLTQFRHKTRISRLRRCRVRAYKQTEQSDGRIFYKILRKMPANNKKTRLRETLQNNLICVNAALMTTCLQ